MVDQKKKNEKKKLLLKLHFTPVMTMFYVTALKLSNKINDGNCSYEKKRNEQLLAKLSKTNK